jgi:hypothetical protein
MSLKVSLVTSPIVVTSLQLSLMLTLLLITLPSSAEKTNSMNNTLIQSYSSGQLATTASKASKDEVLRLIKQRIIIGDSDQKQKKFLTATRDEIIKLKQLKTQTINPTSLSNKITKMGNINAANRSFSDGTFVIYEGYSQLIEDYDYDGYYQTFSVTFDADLVTYNPYDQAEVYAELYLSENGGPWQHYFTTDSYIIQGESTDDTFEVYSTLQQGFNSNHYDVMIDLYEVGYSNIIASYSSDDSSSLYALPLESSDYDLEHVEYYEETHIHGGSHAYIGLLIIAGVMLMRRLTLI